MKKILKLILTVAIIVVANNSFAQEPQIPADLVGYWPFNGNLEDISGNNNHCTGSVNLTEDKNNEPLKAYDFSGNNYLTMNTSYSIVNNWSIAVLIKPSSVSGNRRILRKLSSGSTDNNEIRLGISSGKIEALIIDQNGSSAGGYKHYIGNSELSQSTWYHVLLKWDGTNLQIFVDGIEDLPYNIETDNNITMSASGSLVAIGKSPQASTTDYFYGVMDEVMLFNRALTESEIQGLNTTTSSSQAETGYWSKSENTEDIYYENGNVRIGIQSTTYNSNDYKLAVQGTILSTELKVVDILGWADYVFDPDYYLKPLEEVEEYIKEHRHLENVPSEKEVKENGLNIVENNTVLLRKIEEQMLYLIEQNKKTKEQSIKIKEQEKVLKEQSKKIKVLEEEKTKTESLAELVEAQQKAIEYLKKEIEELKKN